MRANHNGQRTILRVSDHVHDAHTTLVLRIPVTGFQLS